MVPVTTRETSLTRKLTVLTTNPAVHICAVMVLGILVYSNTLHGPFQWDEWKDLVGNPFVHDISYPIESFRSDPVLYEALKQRYIGFLSFALNYSIHGYEVEGYHVFNIALHLANSMLVYLLVYLSFRTPFLRQSSVRGHSTHIALFSSLVFVCHPVHTEVVNYISERYVLLMTLFYLSSLSAYIAWRIGRQNVDITGCRVRTSRAGGIRAVALYSAAFVSACLAMKSKENAVTLPVMITLYEMFFFSGDARKRLAGLLPLLATSLIIPLTFLFGLGMSIRESTRFFSETSRTDYLFSQFSVLMTYLRTLLLPINLNFDHDHPLYHSLLQPRVALSLLSLLSLFTCGVLLYLRSRPRRSSPHLRQARPDADGESGGATPFLSSSAGYRLVSFGIFWFFVTISIESSIFPLPNLMNEYRLYLPSVGLIASMVCGAGSLMMPNSGRPVGKGFFAVSVVLLLIFSVAAFTRNSLWKSNVSLWQDAVRKSPNKVRPHNNLGESYEKLGKFSEAVAEYKEVLRLNPPMGAGGKFRAKIGILGGQFDEAEQEFREVLKGGMDHPEAHNYFAMAFVKKGQIGKAIEELEIAVKLKPTYSTGHYNLGNLYAQAGRPEDAILELETAVRLEPSYSEWHFNLGDLYAQKGRLEDAKKAYLAAIRLKSDFVEAHNNLAGIYAQLGRYDEAVRELQTLLKLKPDLEDARYNLKLISDLKAGTK